MVVTVKIVDAHTHVGSWPEFDLDFQLEDLAIIMKADNYHGVVVTPALRGDPLMANAELQVRVRDSNQRFYFFAWVPGVGVLDYLRTQIKEIRGLKFHASISQMSIGDSRMAPYLEFSDAHGLPLLYHAGRTPISWPDHLMAIVDSYPNIKFILGHAGGTAYDRAVDTLKRWPTLPENVYAEISTQRWPTLLKTIVATWGEDRVLYGSDLPFTDMRLNWHCIELAGLDRDEDFLGGNLLRLLKAR